MIPAHQIGFCKYWWLWELSVPDLEEVSIRPFFVMINDVPIANDDDMASARPIYLSSTMGLFWLEDGRWFEEKAKI